MKKILMTMLFATLTMGVAAQSAKVTHVKNGVIETQTLLNDSTFTPPQFRGGDKALKKFLASNLKYPELAASYHVEGRVVMHFFVNTDGSISDISAGECTIDRFNTTKFTQEPEAKQKELKEQFALLFAKEGARVIRKMRKWTPAQLNGQVVRVKFNLPLRFEDPNK